MVFHHDITQLNKTFIQLPILELHFVLLEFKVEIEKHVFIIDLRKYLFKL